MKPIVYLIFVLLPITDVLSDVLSAARIGCYRDTADRSIPGTVTFYDAKYIIVECYERAKAEGKAYFAVQNNAECRTSSDTSYNKYGLGTDCVNGKGGNYLNTVYKVLPAHSTKPNVILADSCPLVGVDLDAGTSLNTFVGIESWKICSRICTMYRGCNAWVYNTVDRNCWMKASDGNRQPNKLYKSGTKACVSVYRCSFVDGVGVQKGETSIGILGWDQYIGRREEMDCIDGCVKEKARDDSINGVTMSKSKGCYCEKSMNSVGKGPEGVRTCFLEKRPQDLLRCDPNQRLQGNALKCPPPQCCSGSGYCRTGFLYCKRNGQSKGDFGRKRHSNEKYSELVNAFHGATELADQLIEGEDWNKYE